MKKLLLGLIFFLTLIPITDVQVEAYGGCFEYGIMAYEVGDSCKCMSGYVFGKDFLGKTACVSADQMCKDQYGYNASSDYLTNNCKCNYGYSFGKDMFGKTQCISDDQMCKDKLGYGARYNSLYDSCECGYGDIIINGKCTNASNYCSSKHGLYADYNSSSKKCECDSGYTLDDNLQCVKKQNNAYFTLKELDTDNKKAIIKSDHDYSYYLVEYNSGCYPSSFRRYLNDQIVVNLGTDFNLDTWDKIVLQDDDETCDITRKEKVDSAFSLEDEEDDSLTIEQLIALNELNKNNTPPTVINTPPTPIKTNKPNSLTIKTEPKVVKEEIKEVVETVKKTEVETEKSMITEPEDIKALEKISWFKRLWNWVRGK